MSILLAGNYCHDTLLTAEGEHRALGGSAAYASAVFEALRVEYEVVAKVGPDFRYAPPRPARVVNAPTTSFVDDYRGGERRESVEAVCEPIAPEDLRGAYDAGIACGVAGETTPRTVERMRALCRILLADAQSLLRHVEGRAVTLKPPRGVPPLDWLKASVKEAALLDIAALRRRMGVLITDGPNGVTILHGANETHLPAVPAVERDPTGAGDCFLAAFTVALVRGESPLEAARFGAIYGARAVEQVGIPRFQ